MGYPVSRRRIALLTLGLVPGLLVAIPGVGLVTVVSAIGLGVVDASCGT